MEINIEREEFEDILNYSYRLLETKGLEELFRTYYKYSKNPQKRIIERAIATDIVGTYLIIKQKTKNPLIAFSISTQRGKKLLDIYGRKLPEINKDGISYENEKIVAKEIIRNMEYIAERDKREREIEILEGVGRVESASNTGLSIGLSMGEDIDQLLKNNEVSGLEIYIARAFNTLRKKLKKFKDKKRDDNKEEKETKEGEEIKENILYHTKFIIHGEEYYPLMKRSKISDEYMRASLLPERDIHIVGNKKAKEFIENVCHFLSYYDGERNLMKERISFPQVIDLYGDVGSGKTELTKYAENLMKNYYMQQDIDTIIYHLTMNDFNSYVNGSARRLEQLFNNIERSNERWLVVIDEFETMFFSKSNSSEDIKVNGVLRRVLGSVKDSKGNWVMIITSNEDLSESNRLEPQVKSRLRGGAVRVEGVKSVEEYKELLQIMLRKEENSGYVKLGEDDYFAIAEEMYKKGFTGRDIEKVVERTILGKINPRIMDSIIHGEGIFSITKDMFYETIRGWEDEYR